MYVPRSGNITIVLIKSRINRVAMAQIPVRLVISLCLPSSKNCLRSCNQDISSQPGF